MENNMGEFTVSDEKLREFLKILFPDYTTDKIEEMLKNQKLRRIYASQYEGAYKYGLNPNTIANQVANNLKNRRSR